VSCTLSSVTAGDLITVEFSDRNGYETSISDGANGAYTKIYYVQDSADPNYSGMAYFMNSASGSLTVNLALSSTDYWGNISVQAWKGAATSSALDTGAITQHLTSTSGTVANANCGSAQSPAGAGELIIGYVVPDNNFSVTAGTNYTLIDTSNSNGNPVFPEYWIQSAATATNGPFTSAADDFTEGCAAFKPASSSTQITLDGSNHCTNGGSNVTSVSCTLSSVTAGDLITVEFSDRNGYETSISDGANGAYTKIYYVQDSADPNYSGMAYFMNSASGSLTVKVSASGSDPWVLLSVQAWKGASTTSVLDTGAITQHLTSTSGTVANANCGSAQSPAGAGELIIGYLVPDNDFSVTAGTNYTLIDVPSTSFGNPSFPEYRIQTISQATNGPFTSAADDWTEGCAAFKAMGSSQTPPNLTITTNSLPNGQVGVAYSANLNATGGTTPYRWLLTSGTLPAGLLLNTSTGAITGTPTATANATALTFKVSDSSSPAQSQSVNLTLTIAQLITVSVSPKRAGLTITQRLSVTPTTSDGGGVNWSVSGSGCSGSACGTLSSGSTANGIAVVYTTPGTAGQYTITATSANDGSKSASVSVAVTDLAGVTTYHNNISRNGANTQEYALTTSSVTTSTFGKLFSCSVDSAVYAQPLWMPNLTISSAKHNVILVATQNDSLYAFDADTNSTPCTPLWHANLIDSSHGANSGETAVPSAGSGTLVGSGNGDIAPEVGVTGTPVIDPATNTLYVVSKSAIISGPSFYQRLHAIDLLTGNEKFSGPVTIAATYPGTGDGGTTTTFAARGENQRPGLALVNGVVYIAWASHEDNPPWYGWVIGYNANDLSQASVFNDAPNAGKGGIWMSGGAPAADFSGNLYLITGNANFDATSSTAPNNDYGDSFLKLTSSLRVSQYFTPSDESTDNSQDHDFGSGGAAVLVDLPMNGTNPTHLVIGGGKDGTLYLLNRDSMGGLGDSNAWQPITLPGGIFSTGAFWNSNFYIATNRGSLLAFSLSSGTAKLTQAPNVTSATFGFPSGTPSVSSMPDNSNGIVWILDNSQYCTPQSHGCGPAILYAFDASDLATELWNSTQGTGNSAGNAVKFTVPTVANGKVYVGTRGNNTGGVDGSTSTPGELEIYGLLPN
jgi:hypothetical protein